jgi:hypothetical protein
MHNIPGGFLTNRKSRSRIRVADGVYRMDKPVTGFLFQPKGEGFYFL